MTSGLFEHGALGFPSQSEPVVDSRVLDARPLCPLREVQRFTVNRETDILTLVLLLLERCRPSHIARLVTPVVVQTVQLKPRLWHPAHVLQKALKRIPAGTDGDPSVGVVGSVLLGVLCDALSHSRPRFVFRALFRLVAASRLAVGYASGSRDISKKATARAHISRLQMIGINDDALAAIAYAQPARAVPDVVVHLHHSQAREAPSRQIFSKSSFGHTYSVMEREARCQG